MKSDLLLPGETNRPVKSRPSRVLSCTLLSLWLFVYCLLAVGCSGDKEDQYFDQAAAQFEQGDWAGAVQTYDQYLEHFQKGTRREEGLFQAGQVVLYALHDKALAVHYFNRLITEFPTGDYAYRAREILAPLFADEVGDYTQAAIEYRWLAQQQPDNPETPRFLFQAAKCLLADGQIENAILEMGKLIQYYPHSDLTESVWDELGAAYMLLERYSQSIYICKKFEEKFPNSPLLTTAQLRMGRAFEENQQYELALKIYAKLLKTYDNPQVIRLRINGIKERWLAKFKKPIPENLLPQPVEEEGPDNESMTADQDIESPEQRLNRSSLDSDIDQAGIKKRISKERNKP